MSDKQFLYHSPIVGVLNDHEWELEQPFVFEWAENNDHHRITIPAGFATDGASVPRICWTLTGLIPTGVHLGAAVVHDYAYQRRGFINGGVLQKLNPATGDYEAEPVEWSRKQCDDIFLLVMQAARETPWKAYAMYWAVRMFGARAWDK